MVSPCNTGQILFGLIFILLRDKLPFNMELISQWGQGIVGGTLIIIGVIGFWEAGPYTGPLFSST